MVVTWQDGRHAPEVVVKMGPELQRVRPLLDLDEPFRFHETPLDPTTDHQFLRRLERYGALEPTGKVRPEYPDQDKSSHWVNEYRWDSAVKPKIRAYLGQLETLPCGHHVHIHNPRGSAPDELGCKVCAENGIDQRHPKALVRELLEMDGGGD